jgi:hypothetical protein
MNIGFAKRAFFNETHCGDQFSHWQHDGKTLLCMVDGLGHGIEAEKAAKAALDYVSMNLSKPLAELFFGCDQALRKTRGVAMEIAIVDPAAEMLTYAGIGNTRAIIYREPPVYLVGNYGIVGGGYKTLSPTTISLSPFDLVILFTDGLPENIDLSGYGNILLGNVSRLAEKILLDWRSEIDDAAVAVFSTSD